MYKKLLANLLYAPDTGSGGYQNISQDQFDVAFTGAEPEEQDNFEAGELASAIDNSNEMAPAAPEAPQTYSYKSNGEERQATIEELLQTRSQFDNYTQKMQELSTQRQQHEQEYQPFMELAQLFDQSPELAQGFEKLLQETFSGGDGMPNQQQAQQQPFDVFQDPRVQQMNQQMTQMQEYFESMQKQEFVKGVENEWQSLSTKYPDAADMQKEIFDWADAQMEAGVTNVNLEMAYRNLAFDKIQERTKHEMAANATKKKTAKTVTPANGGQSSAKGKAKNYKDVWSQMLEDGVNPTF